MVNVYLPQFANKTVMQCIQCSRTKPQLILITKNGKFLGEIHVTIQVMRVPPPLCKLNKNLNFSGNIGHGIPELL
jgi:hypothetical protein